MSVKHHVDIESYADADVDADANADVDAGASTLSVVKP